MIEDLKNFDYKGFVNTIIEDAKILEILQSLPKRFFNLSEKELEE